MSDKIALPDGEKEIISSFSQLEVPETEVLVKSMSGMDIKVSTIFL